MKLIIILNLFYVAMCSAQSCTPSEFNCDYYKCKEAVLNCGERGYLNRFALKYCRKFERMEHKLSENGKDWLRLTKKCLQNQVEELQDNLMCRDIKRQSFKSHLKCYQDSGYCQLTKNDKRKIFKVVLPSLYMPRVLMQGLNLMKNCKREKE